MDEEDEFFKIIARGIFFPLEYGEILMCIEPVVENGTIRFDMCMADEEGRGTTHAAFANFKVAEVISIMEKLVEAISVLAENEKKNG